MSTKIDLHEVRRAVAIVDADLPTHNVSLQYMLGTSTLVALAEAARAYLSLLTGEPSEEMVERVARAILRASYEAMPPHPAMVSAPEEWVDQRWPEFADIARAAISAALKGE